MKKLSFLAFVLCFCAVHTASAQDRFFTLSGGDRSDAASSKIEVLHKQLRERQDAEEACAALGKVYAPEHARKDDAGCISSLILEQTGDATLESNLTVGGGVRIGGADGKLVQKHALEDPNLCSDKEKLYWTGSDWACRDEIDPKVGTLTAGKWCAEKSGKVVCDRESPELEGSISDNVHNFALKASSFPSGGCAQGEVLTTNGSTLSCTADEGGRLDTILLADLDDVSLNNTKHGDVLTYNAAGSVWVSAAEGDPTVEDYAKYAVQDATSGNCGIGYVVGFLNGKLECVPDAGGIADAIYLGELADVTNTAASGTQVLTWMGNEWAPADETDPTVKDWAKVDIANTTSITSVFRCQSNEVITFDGNQLGCATDMGSAGTLYLNDMIDVSHSTPPVVDNVLAWDGTNWVDRQEIDPLVETFAKTVLPTCAAGEVLKGDGTSLSCVADAGSTADPIMFDDLGDVVLTTPTTDQMVSYNGTNWVNTSGPEGFAKTPVINTSAGQCPVGYILTFDGTQLSCIAGTSIGLWTDNSTYIARSGMAVVNSAENLPAGLEGAGVRSVWYPNKGAFRAGEVTSTQWDDVNIGNRSVGFGFDVRASGSSSVAGGKGAVASGNFSVALGNNVVASGAESTALGSENTSSGMGAFSANRYNVASGHSSVGLGRFSSARGQTSFAFGDGVAANADHSVVFGLSSAVSGSTVSSQNTMAIVGGQMVISDTTASGTLALDVEGSVGAIEYCDENGANCQTMADIGNAISSLSTFGIDDLVDAASNAGSQTVYLGSGSGSLNSVFSTAVGYFALGNNTTGNANTAMGRTTLYNNTSGSHNTAFGSDTMYNNTTGFFNTAFGTYSLRRNTTGHSNTALGFLAQNGVDGNSTGSYNVSLGYEANKLLTTGNNNIAIGASVSVADPAGNDQLNIGNSIYGNLLTDFIGIGVESPSASLHVVDAGIFEGDLTVKGNLNVSGTQSFDGVTFANGGIQSSGNISATSFTGDGSGLTGVTASSADWYGLTNIPTGVENISNTALDTFELTQLQNIDATTITTTQFGYLGAMDQSVASTDDVKFADVSVTNLYASGNIGIGKAAVNVALDISSSNNGDVLLQFSTDRPWQFVQSGDDSNTQLHLRPTTNNKQFQITSLDGAESYFRVISDTFNPRVFFEKSTVGISNTLISGSLSLDVDGQVGAIEYCDENGANCQTMADIGNAMSSLSSLGIDDLVDAASNAVSGTLFLGDGAGDVNTAIDNTGVGVNALASNVDGDSNVAVGARALSLNVSGDRNVALGVDALYNNTSSFNTALGDQSLEANTTGNFNSAVGHLSLNSNVSGSRNSVLGYAAAQNQTAGNNNIAIGSSVNLPNLTGSNQLNIGNTIYGNLLTDFIGIGVESPSASLHVVDAGIFEGDLTVKGNLNVSGTQSFDGVTFANGGVQSSGNISATSFTGDGSGLTGVTASSADWYALTNIPTGVEAISNTELDAFELTQLQNIDATTITTTQFGYLGAMDQSVSTTSDVAFNSLTAAANVYASGDISTAADLNVDGRADVGADVSVTGTVQAAAFVGDGASITNISASALSIGIDDLTDAIASTASGTVFLGSNAGVNNTGVNNTTVGMNTLSVNTTGERNSAFGFNALRDNTSGSYNVALGRGTLAKNTTGSYNMGMGVSLENNTTGSSNVGVGYGAMYRNDSGDENVAIGSSALRYNTTGHSNLAQGYQAQYGVDGNSTGSYNVSLGHFANKLLTTGNNNIAIGASVSVADPAGNDQLNIGDTIFGDLANKRIQIGTTSNSAGSLIVGSSLNNVNGGLTVMSEADSGALMLWVGNDGIRHIDAASAGTAVLGINQGGGYVGIGTTAPSSTLHVNGMAQVAGTGSEACDNNHLGAIRFNPSTGKMQICRQ